MNLNATIFGQIISFALFVWFCMKYVWFPLISIIEKRQKEISDNLVNIKHAKTESDRINAEALDCLKMAKMKAQEIINHANACKMEILNRAKYEANEEQKRILFQTRERIVYEKNCVVAEIKQSIGQLVIEATEKIIGCSINTHVDHDVIDTIIKELSCSYSKDEK